MSDALRYPVPADRCRADLSIDRSRFICTLVRAATPAEAQAFIREMNAEFPDATHNCWAYVAGAPGSTTQIGMSDDGEPHGTAGRPMLTVLLHSGVGEIAAVVTRYFGGTKLGTGGLVKAYSASVQAALDVLSRVERVDYGELSLSISYAQIAAVRHLLLALEGEVLDEAFAESVTMRVRVPLERMPALRAAVGNATNGTAILLDGTP